MLGTYPCQMNPVISGRSTQFCLPSPSKKQSSTRVAISEKTEKFVPAPSDVAPSGYGVPGQTFTLESLRFSRTMRMGSAKGVPRAGCGFAVHSATREANRQDLRLYRAV